MGCRDAFKWLYEPVPGLEGSLSLAPIIHNEPLPDHPGSSPPLAKSAMVPIKAHIVTIQWIGRKEIVEDGSCCFISLNKWDMSHMSQQQSDAMEWFKAFKINDAFKKKKKTHGFTIH